MVALSLDNSPSRLSKLQPHLHDHPIDALPNNTKALALNDNLAIDMLLENADALTPDDNHAIASNALLQKPAALTLGDNYDIDTLPNNTGALAVDDNHTIDSLLQKLEALAIDDNYAIDTLQHKSDAHTLDDNASQLSKCMLHDDTNDSPNHQHLRCNTTDTLLQNIEAINPRTFNYDTPYTTMLSTPYFEIWNLLFSTIVPRSHKNLNSTRRLRIRLDNASLPTYLWCQRSPTTRRLMASLAVPYDMELYYPRG
ncbi:hypothetical protein BDR05DRAFT_995906 [Suillus weaverae]|nr:hypothetical protein BDR05DRAFT_995906 [Suillus weaverae]